MIFRTKTVRLSLASFILLFLELLLIRLIGTEIRIFSYISNFILLTVFMGSGIGMLMKPKVPLTVSILCLAVLTGILAFGIFSDITHLIAPISDSYIWSLGEPKAPLFQIVWGMLRLLMILILITGIFVPLGQCVSDQYDTGSSAVKSYMVNMLFSVAGVWCYFFLSWASITPYAGILIGQCMLLLLIPASQKVISIMLAIATILVIVFLGPKNNVIWSPYQKLTIAPLHGPNPQHKFIIDVNNVGFMALTDMSNPSREQSIDKAVKENQSNRNDMEFLNSYSLPHFIKPGSTDVLIIGAGGGNDVAAAVRAGATHIDAVEIDPQVLRLGTLYHPEHPYLDTRVRKINDDGRSFIRQTEKKYDIVVYGFVDSHTTNSNVTNIQLDNYLYTLESFREIRAILKPGGILFLSFSIPRPWIGGHIQQTLAEAFRQTPVVFTFDADTVCLAGCDGTFFVISQDMKSLEQDISRVPGLSAFIRNRRIDFPKNSGILHDNWPFLYLEDTRIPNVHIVAVLLITAIFLLLGKRVSVFSGMQWTSFFLGAAFLLYEFQNITRTSLLFGNTWVVNAYAVSATLIMGVLAIVFYMKYSVPIAVSFIGLFVSLMFETFFPLAVLNGIGFGWRLCLTSIILYIPVFFSGMVFIATFSRAKNKKTFLGSNLVGSFFGGTLSMLSYVYGLHAMLYAEILLYMIALATLRRRSALLHR